MLDVIKDLNYSPDIFARNFRTGKKSTIAFIVPDISNKFFATLIESVESIISREGYHLIIANTKEQKDREFDHINYFCSGVVDGLLLASTMDNLSEITSIVPDTVPIVFLDRTFANNPWDSVTISSLHAINQGINLLYRKGHRKIGYIAGLPHISSTIDRTDSYINAMNSCSLPVEDGFIQYYDPIRNNEGESTRSLLKLGCTAIMISNGIMSLNTVVYCEANNVKLGEDIDLVCFNDNSQYLSRSKNIGLIVQPVDEMGQCVGNQILSRLKNPQLPVKETVLIATFLEPDPNPLSKYVWKNVDI